EPASDLNGHYADNYADHDEPATTSEPSEAETPEEPTSQESTAELLKRLGMYPQLEGEEAEPAPTQPASPSRPGYAEPQASQSGHADENEDDFSVEDYMSRLMARIQGQTSAPPSLYHPLEKDPPAVQPPSALAPPPA